MHPTPFPPYLREADLDALIDRTLAEDVGPGDVTTQATIPARTKARATFLAKAPGIVAGLDVAARIFRRVDPELRVVWTVEEGDSVHEGDVFGAVSGAARPILTAERLALNLMQRMSGIATATHRMVEAARPVRILDTRKTAPGLRALDKWAVLLGGGANHRIGLYDMVLIKDNHIKAAGGIRAAVEAALRYLDEHGLDLEIEVETTTRAEIREALDTGAADWILLDNMVDVRADGTVDTARLAAAVALVDGRARTEASGNVTLRTVAAIAATGVDAISSGALTHSVTALDISLNVVLER